MYGVPFVKYSGQKKKVKGENPSIHEFRFFVCKYNLGKKNYLTIIEKI